MIEIPLTKGYIAVVDDVDADLAQYKWQAIEKKNGVYASRRGKNREAGMSIGMHRTIGARIVERGLIRSDDVDHKDGNGLNNVRTNLRVCSHTQNLQNRKLNKNNKIGFKGVSIIKSKRNPYKASINVNGKAIRLGCFPTPELAHKAYCEAAKEYFGEFARFE